MTRSIAFLLLCTALLSYPSEGAEPKKAVSINRAAVPDAQLNLKPSYDVGEPIRVGCTCAPVEGVKLTTEWAFSPGLQHIAIDDLTQDVWSKPGPQKISVKLKMLKTHSLVVLVPGPNWPTDPKDMTKQVIVVFDGYSESTLEGEFVQQGTINPVPIPIPPVPIPVPPDPTPQPPVVGPFRVLVLEETDDRIKYTENQKAAYLGASFREYVGSHASKTGDTADARIWDDDFTSVNPGWDILYAKAKTDSGANTAGTKEPWMIIEQKGVPVYSGQITDPSSTLIILKTYGGP